MDTCVHPWCFVGRRENGQPYCKICRMELYEDIGQGRSATPKSDGKRLDENSKDIGWRAIMKFLDDMLRWSRNTISRLVSEYRWRKTIKVLKKLTANLRTLNTSVICASQSLMRLTEALERTKTYSVTELQKNKLE